MIIDGQLLFTGTSNGASGGVTASAYADTVAQVVATYICSNIIDLGVTSGIPASSAGGGARDISIGDNPMLKLLAQITTALTSGGAATLQVELDGAVDNGSGAPSGTWTVMWQSQAIGYASLTAGTYMANVDIPRPAPGEAAPRFLRMRFIVAGATITAGAMEAAVVLDRFDAIGQQTGYLSGYPAGINIAN